MAGLEELQLARQAYPEALGSDPYYGAAQALGKIQPSKLFEYSDEEKKSLYDTGNTLLSQAYRQKDQATADAYAKRAQEFFNAAVESQNPKKRFWIDMGQALGKGVLGGIGESRATEAVRPQYERILSALGEPEALAGLNEPGWTPQSSELDLMRGLQKLESDRALKLEQAKAAPDYMKYLPKQLAALKAAEQLGISPDLMAQALGGQEVEAGPTEISPLQEKYGERWTPPENPTQYELQQIEELGEDTSQTRISARKQTEQYFGNINKETEGTLKQYKEAARSLRELQRDAEAALKLAGPYLGASPEKVWARTKGVFNADLREGLMKLNNLASRDILSRKFPGALSDPDREFLLEGAISAKQSKEALERFIAQTKEAARKADDAVAFYNNYKTDYKSYKGADVLYNEIRDEIGGPTEFLTANSPNVTDLYNQAKPRKTPLKSPPQSMPEPPDNTPQLTAKTSPTGQVYYEDAQGNRFLEDNK